MTNTRGSLVPAKIYEVDEQGNPSGGAGVACMFNPFEYTVSKSNSYQEKPRNSANTPQGEFFKSGAQTLKLLAWLEDHGYIPKVVSETAQAYSADEQEAVQKRLKSLGYVE